MLSACKSQAAERTDKKRARSRCRNCAGRKASKPYDRRGPESVALNAQAGVVMLSDRFAAMWLTARINRNGEPARQNTARLQDLTIMRIMYIMLNKEFNSFFQPASLLADLDALTKDASPDFRMRMIS